VDFIAKSAQKDFMDIQIVVDVKHVHVQKLTKSLPKDALLLNKVYLVFAKRVTQVHYVIVVLKVISVNHMNQKENVKVATVISKE
jgi:hypothetical protein